MYLFDINVLLVCYTLLHRVQMILTVSMVDLQILKEILYGAYITWVYKHYIG